MNKSTSNVRQRKRNSLPMNIKQDDLTEIFEPLNKKYKLIDDSGLIEQSENSKVIIYQKISTLSNMDFKQTSSNFSSIIAKNSHNIPSHNGNPCGRKIEIKNFKARNNIPHNFEELVWGKLFEAIQAIQDKKPIKKYSLEELYRSVQDMCLRKFSCRLYSNLTSESTRHTKSYLSQFVKTQCNSNEYLNMLEKCWSDHCNQMIMIRSIFLYLDRTYVLQTPDIKSIWDMGIQLFADYIIGDLSVQTHAINGLLVSIEKERSGDVVDRMLLKKLLRMLSVLQVYENLFEPKFLEETKNLFFKKSYDLMQNYEMSVIIEKIDKIFIEENERISFYLDSSTGPKLISCLEEQLISKNIVPLLEKGFCGLMKERKSSHLKTLYDLFGRVANGHAELLKYFTEYIREEGTELVQNSFKEDGLEKELVASILKFKDDMDNMILNCFGNNAKYITHMKESFEIFVNSKNDYVGELIARYIDSKMKTNLKDFSDNDNENWLDKILVLFRFISGKDMFEGFYKKDLSKRLLVGKSSSLDTEKSMLLKLKSECGPAFTIKLEGMFKDMDTSKEIMSVYKTVNSSASKLEVNCTTLTKSYWPDYQCNDIVIPSIMRDELHKFHEFYVKKFAGRSLEWQHSLGSCILKARFKTETKELSVSLYQALVLLLFNEKESISYKDILEHTKIGEEELKRTLQSLACINKIRVLNKIPKGREIGDDDVFEYISNFKHKLVRIRINQIQMKETKKDHSAIEERVFQDRQYNVDATIVRIMKTRKKISHNMLIAELYSLLKFNMKPTELKARIESLIDRDYIQRDESNSQLYIYMA